MQKVRLILLSMVRCFRIINISTITAYIPSKTRVPELTVKLNSMPKKHTLLYKNKFLLETMDK